MPTLALLLGAPIPFSSLGAVISDLFTPPLRDDNSQNECPIPPVHRAVKALQLNALQVMSRM